MIRWALIGGLIGLLGVAVHELGHYFCALAVGLPGVVLHYSRISYDGSDAIRELALHTPRSLLATQPRFTKPAPLLRLVQSSRLYCSTPRLQSGSYGRAIAPAGVAGVLLLRMFGGNRAPLAANVDEYNAAMAFGLPPLLVIVPVLLAVLGMYLSFDRFKTLLSPALGMIVVLAFYFTVLGPLLLP